MVYFDRASYSVSEDGGNVTLTVRTNVPGGPPNGSVVFFTEDSSANGEKNNRISYLMLACHL